MRGLQPRKSTHQNLIPITTPTAHMNLTPEQLKQNAAVMIAFAEGKPIQYLTDKWYNTRHINSIASFLHRVKPSWTLPAPPTGRKWHREDWTEEMLPVIDGKQTRPLLHGETIVYGKSGDEYKLDSPTDNFHWQSSVATNYAGIDPNIRGFWRTTRPLPVEPKTRGWNKPEDVPGPLCWLRAKIQPEILMLVSCIWPNGVSLNDGKSVFQKTWDRLFEGEWEHSTDRKTWQPCTITEEAP